MMRAAKVLSSHCWLFAALLLLPVTAARVAHGAVDSSKLPASAAKEVDFERDIQPIFAKHCYSCHGPDKQKGEFRLDVKEKALAGGDSGIAILTGKSAESPLIHFVSGLVEDKVMPQKGERLSAEQIGLLRAWIDRGANWPDHLSARVEATNYWAFRLMVRPPLPAIEATRSPNSNFSNPIDHFILAKLQEKGLALSTPADKATLMRRATFDLLGLPPSPAALDAFLADRSPDAFAKVVDKLLASPRYGERWARHWLDLARFSESDGFEYDKMREQAWHYRDYLVRSFNEDRPYAQFIREQIAGDALDPATREGVIATGFLTAGPYDEAGNSSASALLKARIREEEMEDMIAGVSQTFLAMTVNCARCHDHKFDPIPQRDYYAMKAALDGVRHGNRPLRTSAEMKSHEERLAAVNKELRAAEKQIDGINRTVRDRILQERAAKREPGKDSISPAPIARWTFEGDTRDSIGGLHAELRGGAKVDKGRLVLDGKSAFARTAPLSSPLREKTLEALVTLPSLEQRGGGLISIEAKEGGTFDAIVFGERVPRKWMGGSSSFQRSRDLTASDEDAKPDEFVHLAIVYRSDNSITVFRNGVPYGETYTPVGVNAELQTYNPNDARLLFGLRHTGAGSGFLAAEVEEARLYDRALSTNEVFASARAMGANVISADEFSKAMTNDERSQWEAFLARAAKLREQIKAVPPVEQVYAAVSRQPEPTFILARGDVEKKKSQVTAGGLSVVSRSTDFGLPGDDPEARRRLKLAEWIASPENPLTWRVMVNRIWHYHFGRGLVGTPNDFGVNGERPTHPELLDWLASEFLAQGGSLKKLHRLILLSATYQQSSAKTSPAQDADNRLLSHFPLRRLEAEAVRDAMLSVSGQLNLQMGGPGFRPFKVTVSGSHFYELIDPVGPEFNRRTLYRMNIQSGKDPLLDSLDCPDPSTKTPARSMTTTPIQSLGLMNNAFVQRQCRHFAERLKKEAGENPAAQIRVAYRLAFGREPRKSETAESLELARAHGLESLCWALFNASEFIYVR